MTAWADGVPNVPARTIVGERDLTVSMPGMREAFDNQPIWLPNGKPTIFIEDCGHFAQMERPEAVCRHVLNHIGGG